jgi:hypothetical protein
VTRETNPSVKFKRVLVKDSNRGLPLTNGSIKDLNAWIKGLIKDLIMDHTAFAMLSTVSMMPPMPLPSLMLFSQFLSYKYISIHADDVIIS